MIIFIYYFNNIFLLFKIQMLFFPPHGKILARICFSGEHKVLLPHTLMNFSATFFLINTRKQLARFLEVMIFTTTFIKAFYNLQLSIPITR